MYSDITDCFLKNGLSLLSIDAENDNQSMVFTNAGSNSIQRVFSALQEIGFEPSKHVPQILLIERDRDRTIVLMQNWYLSNIPLEIKEWYCPNFKELKVIISKDSSWINNQFDIWDKILLRTRIQRIKQPGGIQGIIYEIGKYSATREQYQSLSSRKHNYYKKKHQKSVKKDKDR